MNMPISREYFCKRPDNPLKDMCPTYAAAIVGTRAMIEEPDAAPDASHLTGPEREAHDRAARGLAEDLIAEGRTGLETAVSEIVPASFRCPPCPIAAACQRPDVPDVPPAF